MGSEMCIRDRPYTAQLETLTGMPMPQLLAIGVGGFEILAGLMICLLYTSDAADDLLCVDLGGRRIIKKKNRSCSPTS